MNEIFEVWSLRWHVLQRSLAKDVQPIARPVDASGVSHTASLSLSWLARARAPVQVVARRGR
jgi:hypothetical protein